MNSGDCLPAIGCWIVSPFKVDFNTLGLLIPPGKDNAHRASTITPGTRLSWLRTYDGSCGLR